MLSQRDPYLALHYNIHLCDLFYLLEDLDIASYADDNTIYTVNKRKRLRLSTLETSSLMLFGWFNNNLIKISSYKSHLIMSYAEATTAMINGLPIDPSKTEVLLGITINQELKLPC